MIIDISKRLTKIASFLPKGVFFADIGSDHAYLPCYVCLKDSTAKAIAGEINEGPYNRALETVKLKGLENVIDVRLGNGLQVLEDEEVTHLVIAGMGGSLIEKILDTGENKIQRIKRIITQPNIQSKNIRYWLDKHFFTIIDEIMVEENNIIYEIIVADKADKMTHKTLTDKEKFFGPKFLEQKPNLFYSKWKSELVHLEQISRQISQARIVDREKMENIETQLSWIREVLLLE